MKFIIVAVLVFLANVAYAQVFISEIMYDPEGADTGNEWIEIANNSASPVDLSEWRFAEANTNHKLIASQGGLVLNGSGYAIIVDNPEKFFASHSGYSGTVVNSSFSLGNTGETLALKMPDGSITDTVTYNSNQGGAGNGNSLQKINENWKEGLPTPGKENLVNEAPLQKETNNSSRENSDQSIAKNATSDFPVEPQIFASLGLNSRTTLVGAPIIFSAKVYGLKRESIDNARALWAFGDGAHKEGKSVSHIYYYPGEYTVVLDASSGEFSASSRTRVVVSAPNLVVLSGGDILRSFVSLENKSSEEIDLSGWQIFFNAKMFEFPKNTILSGKKKIIFPSEVTGLSTPLGSQAELRFPNGVKVPLANEEKTPVGNEAVISEVKNIIPTNTEVVKKTEVKNSYRQIASVAEVISDTQEKDSLLTQIVEEQEPRSLLPWYAGIAFLGALALLAIRFTGRPEDEKTGLNADDFEIIEENKKLK